MKAKEFYTKRLADDPTIGSVQLMEEYAKHIIEINFCNGTSLYFEDVTVAQLRKIHRTINECVDWVNT